MYRNERLLEAQARPRVGQNCIEWPRQASTAAYNRARYIYESWPTGM